MSHENVEVVRRLLAAGEREDVPAALVLLDPDVEWIPARAVMEGTYRGREGFERFVEDTRETFEAFEPHFELREAGEHVLAWGTISVRHRRSEIEMDIPVGGIFCFRDGLIARWHDFGSKAAAFEAVGLRE